MDDANLEKLSVSPGKITPKFHKDVAEYTVVVGSNVKELKVSPLTSDSNASYSISGSGGGKTVPLKEGAVTEITIEVTAEDGTTKKYHINATRLSSSDASLSNIMLSSGALSPSFHLDCEYYSVIVPYHISNLEVKPILADKATSVVIRDHTEVKSINLNYGETSIYIDVTSPDKTTSKTYHLLVHRIKIPWPVCFVDAKSSCNYSCPVCLGVFHCPKSITESKPKHVFCKCCVDELTRTTKQNPLNGEPLSGKWQVDEQILEEELGLLAVFCVYSRYGCQEKLKLIELGSHMKQCEYRLCLLEKSEELTANKDLESKMKDLCISCPDCNRSVRTPEIDNHKSYMCSAKLAEESSLPKVPLRPWEKRLQQETSEKSVEVMIQKAEEQEKLYFQSIRLYGQSRHCGSNSSPINYLKQASELYATGIKLSPSDAKLHFKLGQILEELHFVEDCFGFKQEEEADTPAIDFNEQSRDSSKEDDIQAICEQRGVGRNARLALQLKAIDEEYHYLLESQQSDRCEYVQKLYAWKSKQATQDGKVAQQASDEESSFGKAFVKYTDALSFASDNYLYHLHVGRFLLLQGKPEEAVKRLQIALGLKPVNIEARFYLGLALSQLTAGAGNRENEAIDYLHETLEHLLYKLTLKAECPSEGGPPSDNLHSSELLKTTNVQCLKAFILLGKMLARSSTAPPRYLKPEDIFRTVSSLALRGLCSVVNKGELYHQIEWTLLEAHSNFLQLLLDAEKKDSKISGDIVARHCDNLSSLLQTLSLPKDSALLQLQEKTCQQGVLLQPHNSRALFMLGNAQLGRYDNEINNNNSAKSLEEAEQCFRTSLELEGKPSRGKDVPVLIQGQRWWKERHCQSVSKPAASSQAKPSNITKTNQRVSPTKGATTAARGRGRGSPSIKSTAPAARATTRQQPAPKATGATVSQTPARKGSTATKTNTAKAGTGRNPLPKRTASTTKTPPGKAPCRTCSHTHSGETPQINQPTHPTSSVANVPAESVVHDPQGPPNVPSYHPRLGLARVLARSGTDLNESQKFYHEVITMAPDVHDAYIELGDILVKSDPLGAVEVYSKYPFPDPMTYDDAYLHGEIVRLLVKQEKFEDERLGKSMVALGKVMGLSVIEKYVELLDSKLKYSKLLMKIYAEVNGKTADDPELQAFFKFKCWI